MKLLFILTALTLLSACESASESAKKKVEKEAIAQAELKKEKVPNYKRWAFFEVPEAGTDFPTDSPLPAALKNKKILVISPLGQSDSKFRIVVDASAEIGSAEAGIDYPSDSPRPDSSWDTRYLLLSETKRVLINLEDDAGQLYWNFGGKVRVLAEKIQSIEKAVAGIDFPTDSPGGDFYVAVTIEGGKRTRLP